MKLLANDLFEEAYNKLWYLKPDMQSLLLKQKNFSIEKEFVKCQALTRERTGRYMTSCDISRKTMCSSERENELKMQLKELSLQS